MFRKNNENLFREEKAELLGLLPDLKGKRILDLASGIGRFTRDFSSKAHHVTSVDFTPAFVKKNRRDHRDCPNVEYICSDVMNLSFNNNSFDLIFCNWLLIYLDDHEVARLFERVNRWLQADGALFFRESCNLVRTKSRSPGYFAHYRTMREYDEFLKNNFQIIKDGQLNTYIDWFGDPFQCYWHCRKN